MTGNEYSADKKLLALAISEALCNKFDREASSGYTADCSGKHRDRMRLILASSYAKIPKRNIPIKRIIAIIAIAALLLTGCAMFIFREYLFGYKMTYDDLGGVMIESDTPSEKIVIEEYYYPTYIPERYELQTEIKRKDRMDLMYMQPGNSDLAVWYTQCVPSEFLENIDVENTVRSTFELDGVEILCYDYKGIGAVYLWHNHGYIFKITTSIDDYKNEMVKIFRSLEIIEEEEDE